MVYLDWAATSVPDLAAKAEAASLSADAWANPSSAHCLGKMAREALEAARSRLSAAIGCPRDSLFFVSGGTEAARIPPFALWSRKRDSAFVASAIEHPATFNALESMGKAGATLRLAKPGEDGIVRVESFLEAIDDLEGSGTRVAALFCMTVNNETGAIQPVEGISSALTSRAGPPIHFSTDAVQAFGKIPFRADACGADSASFGAHKIGGPRGVGALFLRRLLEGFPGGGTQERGVRPGTENVEGAIAFSLAAERRVAALEDRLTLARRLCARLYEGLGSISGATPIPACRKPSDPRYSPWIAALSFPGVPGEAMARTLSDAGIFVSVGSACSSGTKERRVLAAMGCPEDLALSAIRVSFGPDSTEKDVDAFLETAESAYRRLAVPRR